MASQNLGTLTLDLVANTGGFTGPLDQAARITKKQMKEMGMAVDEFGNYTDKAMKKAAEATKQLDTQFDKLAENLQRETALYGETSRAAQMRYDLEKGALQGLSAAQKDSLTEMTRRLSAMESANAAFREQANAIKQLDASHAQLFASMGREIELYGETTRVAQLRYDMEKGALRDLTEQQKRSIVGRASILDAMDAEAAKTREAAAATKQLDATHDQLNESMLAQLATYGQVTRVAKLRYDMERGALRGLTEAQKQSSIQLAQQLDNLDKAAQGSMRGIRGMATGIGYQMQDIAVQLQMGTNPLMVFAQQGSQIASLFGPTGAVAGAVIAIGGALAGALIPNLFKTGDAAEEVADKVSALVAEMDKLNAAQRQVVETANLYRIADKQKEYDELTKSIAEQRKEVERLTAAQGTQQGPNAAVSFGTLGLAAGSTSVGVNLVESLATATRDLNSAETNRVAIERELAKLNDPAAARELLDNLSREVELIGLSSKELYLKEAAQKSLVGWQAQEYVQLKLNEEQRTAAAKAEEDAEKARTDAAKKAADDERSRADSIAKTIAGMEREIALYGVASKAAQVEYDILNNILKVKGGMEGTEGRRLIQASMALDSLDVQKAAQDDYVAKMKEWVKGENDKVAAVDKIIDGLKKERAELGLNADAYLEVQLRAMGAADAKVKEAIALAKGNREAEASAKQAEEMFKRLDEIGANIWTDLLNGTTNAFDSIKEMFVAMLADMAHQAVTKPIMLNIQQAVSAGGTSVARGASSSSGLLSGVGMGGIYAAGAIAVVAAVSSWNKAQDEKFEKMTAAYRQGVQSTGTLLGMANAKSDSIAQALSDMGDLSGDTLNVNRGMYMALLAIEEGINGVAAGFARQFGISGGAGDWSNIQTGSSAGMRSLSQTGFMKDIESGLTKLDPIGGEFISGFVSGIIGGINKAMYSKSKRIIDSGISFIGQSLADILEQGTVGAFAYADVQSKKRFIGITTSVKLRTETEDLNDILLGQFADVFQGAGGALELAADAFGLEFDNYINRLAVDPQKLSLKDLEGDALVKEIESFFSSTLDGWAQVLTGGSGVLEKFQQVGEGAFETVIRLANQLNSFNQYVDLLNLNFSAVGFSAVEATQAITDAAGGFDQLAASLGTYYQNFFTEEERAAKQMEQLSEALAELGITQVPATREAFRDLIEGLDLTVAAEQEMFAALIGLSGVFSELVEDSEAVEDFITGVKAAFSTLERSVAAEREAIEKANDASIDAITKSLSTHHALASALSSTLNSMTLQSEKYEAQTRRQAQADIIAANAIRRAGGPLPDLEKLAPALEALSRPSVDMFSNFQDYARDFYQTQNALKELEASAGAQVSVDEQMLKNQEEYFDEEMKRLDEVLGYYQRQLDALEGVDNSVISVADAVARLAEAFTMAGVDVGAPLVSMVSSSSPAPQPRIVDRPYAGSVVMEPVANQSFSDFLLELRGLRQDLFTSQYAIAKNTQQSNNLLQRWEVDGLPPEREEL